MLQELVPSGIEVQFREFIDSLHGQYSSGTPCPYLKVSPLRLGEMIKESVRLLPEA